MTAPVFRCSLCAGLVRVLPAKRCSFRLLYVGRARYSSYFPVEQRHYLAWRYCSQCDRFFVRNKNLRILVFHWQEEGRACWQVVSSGRKHLLIEFRKTPPNFEKAVYLDWWLYFCRTQEVQRSHGRGLKWSNDTEYLEVMRA